MPLGAAALSSQSNTVVCLFSLFTIWTSGRVKVFPPAQARGRELLHRRWSFWRFVQGPIRCFLFGAVARTWRVAWPRALLEWSGRASCLILSQAIPIQPPTDGYHIRFYMSDSSVTSHLVPPRFSLTRSLIRIFSDPGTWCPPPPTGRLPHGELAGHATACSARGGRHLLSIVMIQCRALTSWGLGRDGEEAFDGSETYGKNLMFRSSRW
jgi:hypothetical protein